MIFNSAHYIVTIDSVTSVHPVYSALGFNRMLLLSSRSRVPVNPGDNICGEICYEQRW